MNYKKTLCPICAAETNFIGSKKGVLDKRKFNFQRCNSCLFAFIDNPRVDFNNIYNEAYYKGCGADRAVDYIYEFEHEDKTIRNYEWQGIFKLYIELLPKGGAWLDYGCGAGGLVKFATKRGVDAIGYEEGWAAKLSEQTEIQILDMAKLEGLDKKFDFITAIEVFEHVSDPIAVMKKIRGFLKPGGILFLTTGNARPWRLKFLDWSYTNCPDVHISFYEPKTLVNCLQKTGYSPTFLPFSSGFEDIIKFKVLKNIGFKRKRWFLDMLPWKIITKIVDRKYQVSSQPYGIAISHSSN